MHPPLTSLDGPTRQLLLLPRGCCPSLAHVPAQQGDGFDFDAHVARLMEASARETGLRRRTSEDDLNTRGLTRVVHEDYERSDASGTFDEGLLLEGLHLGGGRGSQADSGDDTRRDEMRDVLDAQFEAVREASTICPRFPTKTLGVVQHAPDSRHCPADRSTRTERTRQS